MRQNAINFGKTGKTESIVLMTQQNQTELQHAHPSSVA